MSEEKMREALPSDSEIAAAFDNTNFGSTDYKGIVLEGLRKTALGYHNGWTLTQILRRLGLADARGDGNVLNKRGFDYVLQAALQQEPSRPYCDNSGDVHRADGEWLGECTHCKKQESEAGAVARVTDEGFIIETGLGIAPGSKLYLAPQSAQAIETAAIMKCVEVCDSHRGIAGQGKPEVQFAIECLKDDVEALIPQDGRTQLEEFGMKCIDGALNLDPWLCTEHNLRAIVTNLIGEK